MATAYAGLGSNLGDRRENLRLALGMLPDSVRVKAVSALYETKAVTPDGAEQPPYYNAVARLAVGIGPAALLHAFKLIEAELGRDPDAPRWSPRPIDIDLLLYDDAVISDKGLQVPHPRMAERAFVLVPLAEIAGDLVHPVAGRTVGDLVEGVGDDGVRRLEGAEWWSA